MIKLDIKRTLSTANGKMILDINLSIKKGNFVAIYGDSGAGKTSLLRILAGLMDVDEGSLQVNGNTWLNTGNKTFVAPHKRKIGYVFQDYALFPNMTVKKNLEFAAATMQEKQFVKELITLMELTKLADRKPETLSGGQKQRVALARALVQKPEILLLDEPLSALDSNMRTKLQNYILKVHRQYNLTTLLVSHDASEIIKMADKIIALKDGRIVKNTLPVQFFTGHSVSGKFQFVGQILHIHPDSVISIISVLIGTNLVKIVVENREARKLKPGDKVLVASKAFNPVIMKVTE